MHDLEKLCFVRPIRETVTLKISHQPCPGAKDHIPMWSIFPEPRRLGHRAEHHFLPGFLLLMGCSHTQSVYFLPLPRDAVYGAQTVNSSGLRNP